ncbi:MAG: efflux RND transporter periplasmic adaptor subunit [Pseudomonadota bacterium]
MMLQRMILLGALLAPLSLPAADQIIFTPEQISTMKIQIEPLAPAGAVFGLTLPAQVVVPPAQLRMVSTPQAGMLEQLTVAIGDRVAAGQVLARIQSPDLISLQRDFLQASSQLRLAETAQKRDEALLNEGVIAPRRQQETLSRYQELNAAVEERRQTLRLAGMSQEEIRQLTQDHQLSATLKVRAPIAGVVLESFAEPGQRLEISAPLFRVASLTPLWLEISAPLEQVAGLKPGAHLHVEGMNVEGELIAIGRNVDPASQTVKLRAEVAQGAEKLRPGQYVQVGLTTTSQTQRYAVPANAVVRSGQQAVIFVRTPQGFEPRVVNVLATHNRTAYVTGELKGDESVAISGVSLIKGAWLGLGRGE